MERVALNALAAPSTQKIGSPPRRLPCGLQTARSSRFLKRLQDFLLILNAGSSSLKFAVFAADGIKRLASGGIGRIGQEAPEFSLSGETLPATKRPLPGVPDHARGLEIVLREIRVVTGDRRPSAVGHRVVHGGIRYRAPARIDDALLAELRRLSPADPEHLPAEISLIAAVRDHFPDVPQVACFDTAFHRDLPRRAFLFPIPLRYEKEGIRRFGFHGLSYEYLMSELARLDEPAAVTGRIILAHLGSGASLAAVENGRCIDTTMGFTPAGGIPMGTRPGDLDPGLFSRLVSSQQMSPLQFERMIHHESGLLGLSGTSADLRDLLAREATDERAAVAVEIFCYQARKAIGAQAAALGGLDLLVFTGGVGENSAAVRARICAGLGFLGIAIDGARNEAGGPVISSAAATVKVRAMKTDEEQIIARAVVRHRAERTS
ncbi:MAG: Acetate kinase [Verrucomicrobia bacterium]|nr:Acetate kinase [Verrucomicrobiota bacterium]